ncbi:urease accessory protein UreD [Sphingobacterium haloxyli]|uniref:Urease accessory protein UreD n=1 Tax=Sphingobacterium haloxyli TaxID=2100533 RepID=A0A2S9J6A5_9SPHI|nr:urease accessory protein UreD [Sphingobacterium haloxyli]PRD48284.1 urease accessory protein UreD [Sphingobacterium haloxyli]
MDSIIKINVEREGNRSLLKESYHNAPYKLTHYGSPRAQDHLEMIIMSASPGILDKDSLVIDVHVKESAHLKLFTQSFNKLHPMKEGASQETNVRLDRDSVFNYVPHPVTPFKDSIFKTVNTIHIDDDATLIWGDIISAGRIHRNEVFAFQKLHSITRIYKDGKLLVTDNQCLLPREQPVSDLLFFEGYTHQATLFYCGPFAKLMKDEMDEILTMEYEDVSFGFTECADNTLMLRAVGTDGELLYSFLTMLAQMCWVFTHDQLAVKAEETTKLEAEVAQRDMAGTDLEKKEVRSVVAKKANTLKKTESKGVTSKTVDTKTAVKKKTVSKGEKIVKKDTERKTSKKAV